MAHTPVLLTIEDEEAIVDLMRVLVEPLEIEVVEAPTGAVALERLQTLRPDLVTLDLVLPDIDGLTLLERFRARRDLDDVPIIVISALADSATAKRAYGLGAADFIAKPFNVDLLDAKLRVFLRLRQLSNDLRERERFLVEVVEHLSSGLAVCDRQGRVLRLNAAGALQLGLPDASAALGHLLAEAAPGAEAFLTVEPGDRQRRATVKTPTGTRQLGFTSGQLEGGGVVVVFRELSVAEVAQREAETRKRFEALARAARAFAHEVRNPLTAISAAGQVLQRPDVPVAMGQRLSRAIDGEARRVAELVREYVDAQAPAPPSGTVDLRELLQEIVEVNLLGSPGRQRVRLLPSGGPSFVRGNRARLKQVMLNLILNAVAATEASGTVEVDARLDRGGVAVDVRDTGTGIAAEDLPHIFVESFSTRPGGQGLGLAIARRIVEEHEGAIHVESQAGLGTTFTVRLPAAEPSGPILG